MNRKEILEKLTGEQLDKLHSALGTVTSILNPDGLKLSRLSEFGFDDALRMELFELDVFYELVRRAKEHRL